ncbi:MAG: ATP-binding cassette domain-containing protein [Propionibacteriaceae bacterium]|jgi:energy-coupling factor transport system ATP-binding protein|nr:ATP-binding cassette domain-containing protein [Propionibacteriaceae bacterium]
MPEPLPAASLFHVEGLSFAYPQTERLALDRVDVSVYPGEFVVLAGRSGCGKTTLLRHLKTVLAPHGSVRGRILFDGRGLGEVPAREQASRIGFVSQSPENQVVTDKVWHELAFGLESLGHDTPTIRRRVAEVASFFGIQQWYDALVDELSGGQKQILNLAAVMAMQPDVLILDEPTSQLDPIAAEEFVSTLQKLNDELGVTILLSEHRLEKAFSAADKAIVMESGRIIAEGTPGEVAVALGETGDPMAQALPTPIRAYLGVIGDKAVADNVPVTIRDGRTWLSAALSSSRPSFCAKSSGVAESVSDRSTLSSSAKSNEVAKPTSNGSTLSCRAASTGVATSIPPGQEQYDPSSSFHAEGTGVAGSTLDGSHSSFCAESNAVAESISDSPTSSEAELPGGNTNKNTPIQHTSTTETPIVSLSEVWFRYEQSSPDVLRDLALTIQPGELYAVVGGNGTGKSTMLGVLTGQYRPHRGRVNVLGLTPAKSSGRALAEAGLVAVPQNPQTLFLRNTVLNDLQDVATYQVRLRGVTKSEVADKVDAEVARVIDLAEIGHIRHNHPYDISGGEQQRVALAMALLARPRLLLLDEPTKGMDAFFKSRLASILSRLREQEGLTVLMVSHDIEFCARHATKCAMFFNGQAISVGEPREFFAGNTFYTTAAARMSRGILEGVVIVEDIVNAVTRSHSPK